jgi:phospholipase/lecithinase/hemolysin
VLYIASDLSETLAENVQIREALMKDILKKFIGVGLLAWLAFAGSALAAPPQRFIVFGDSLSDPGNAFLLIRDVEIPPFHSLIPDAPYARGGLHFSNGATWVEQLSIMDHAQPSAGPALLIPPLFSNFAVGGARARTVGAFDLPTQVGLFLSDFQGTAPADALYIVVIGGNDLRDALEAFVADPTGATSVGILGTALASIGSNLGTLQAAGARRFLVANVPDIGLTPAVRPLGAGAQALARLLAGNFNAGLEGILRGLENTGVQVVRLNVFGFLNDVVADPAAFGLTDVEHACIQVNTVAHPFCANPNGFFFWDGIHPTKAGHRLLAERANAALNPSAAVATAP